MREIKFRVWDKTEKVMDYTPYFLDGYLNTVFAHEDSLIFLQYTGLKDKNGKEIYEGDVLGQEDYDYDHEHEYGCFNKKGDTICHPYYTDYYHVKYGEFEYGHWKGVGCFCVNDGDVELIDTDDMFVAGNIYENPELLKLNNNN